MWADLFAAMALVFVLEGVLPFLSPPRYRAMMLAASRFSDSGIRTLGGLSMVVGLCVLYLVRT